jgi:hypothetical protein
MVACVFCLGYWAHAIDDFCSLGGCLYSLTWSYTALGCFGAVIVGRKLYTMMDALCSG